MEKIFVENQRIRRENDNRKNNNSNSEFGQRLSELLKSSNVSQRELAHKIGITEAAISRYINSDRTPNGK